MKRSFAAALVFACLLAVLVFYPATHLGAQFSPLLSSTPPYVTFGMVGIIDGQSARLNALLLPTGGPLVAGGSCQVTFTFLDDQGTTIASTTMPATQNQAVHFDFPPLPTAATTRTEIRGTVQVAFTVTPGSTTAAGRACAIVPTMEVFNSTTGQTELLLENPHALPEVIPLAVAH